MESLKENTKSSILSIACRLFAGKGYDAVGVQEICAASKITKPTLYYYFGSKLGILQAIINEKGSVLYEELKNASEYKHEFFESMSKIIVAEINFAKAEPDFFRFHKSLMDAPENSESATCYKELKEKLNALFLDFFEKSSAEFGNMRSKQKLYSSLFHNNIIHIASDVLENHLNDDEDTIYKITHSFIYGFAD